MVAAKCLLHASMIWSVPQKVENDHKSPSAFLAPCKTGYKTWVFGSEMSDGISEISSAVLGSYAVISGFGNVSWGLCSWRLEEKCGHWGWETQWLFSCDCDCYRWLWSVSIKIYTQQGVHEALEIHFQGVSEVLYFSDSHCDLEDIQLTRHRRCCTSNSFNLWLYQHPTI